MDHAFRLLIFVEALQVAKKYLAEENDAQNQRNKNKSCCKTKRRDNDARLAIAKSLDDL